MGARDNFDENSQAVTRQSIVSSKTALVVGQISVTPETTTRVGSTIVPMEVWGIDVA